MFVMTSNTFSAVATDASNGTSIQQQNVPREDVIITDEEVPITVTPSKERDAGQATPVLTKDGGASTGDAANANSDDKKNDEATEDKRSFPDVVTFGANDKPDGVTESYPVPAPAPTHSNTIAPKPPAQSNNAPITVPRGMAGVLVVNGVQVPYVDCHGATVTPEHTGGIWQGPNNLYDDKQGYFVGHNPGVFEPVSTLKTGDYITVRTADGQQRDYVVVNHWIFSNQSYYEDIEEQYLRGYGESIVLQTCMGDYDIKVVVTQAV